MSQFPCTGGGNALPHMGGPTSAFAPPGHSAPALAPAQRVGEFNAQAPANTAFAIDRACGTCPTIMAFATLGELDATLERPAFATLGEFNATLERPAFATLGELNGALERPRAIYPPGEATAAALGIVTAEAPAVRRSQRLRQKRAIFAPTS